MPVRRAHTQKFAAWAELAHTCRNGKTIVRTSPLTAVTSINVRTQRRRQLGRNVATILYSEIRQTASCIKAISRTKRPSRASVKTASAIAATRLNWRIIIKLLANHNFTEEIITTGTRDNEVRVLPYPPQSALPSPIAVENRHCVAAYLTLHTLA
jgi:hypothetical protein